MFIKTFSPSKYNTYAECNLKYRYKYIDYLKENYNAGLSREALQFGSYIHKIFEDGVDSQSVDDLRKIARDLRNNYHFKGRIDDIETCIKHFFEFNSKLEGSISTEMIFEEKISDDFSVNGIIDRVCKSKSSKYLVIDYKTSKREKTKRELYNDPQMLIYALAMSRRFQTPINNITVSHYYPLTGNLVSLKYLPNQVNTFTKRLQDRKWEIRKKKVAEFKPKVNRFCDWCGYKEICPKHGASKEEIDEALKSSNYGRNKSKGSKG